MTLFAHFAFSTESASPPFTASSAQPLPPLRNMKPPSLPSTIICPTALTSKATAIADGGSIEEYSFIKTLGHGSYGRVELARHDETREKVAIKIIHKSQIKNARQQERLRREIRILSLLSHPHIIELKRVIETELDIYLIMEYASGGEVFDYIVGHPDLNEKESRRYFRQILSALNYCHTNNILHRDLKPENLLLDANKKNIKLIDFGFANIFGHRATLSTFCGSPYYAAPEMVSGRPYYGPEVDVWSLGIILYTLLVGRLPFDDPNTNELYRKIMAGKFSVPNHLTPECQNLMLTMIQPDPKLRLTMAQVMSHPWVCHGHRSPIDSHLPIRPPIKEPKRIDGAILGHLLKSGYPLAEIERVLLSEAQHPLKSEYYLLLEAKIRGKSTILPLLGKAHMTEQSMLKQKAASIASPIHHRFISRIVSKCSAFFNGHHQRTQVSPLHNISEESTALEQQQQEQQNGSGISALADTVASSFLNARRRFSLPFIKRHAEPEPPQSSPVPSNSGNSSVASSYHSSAPFPRKMTGWTPSIVPVPSTKSLYLEGLMDTITQTLHQNDISYQVDPHEPFIYHCHFSAPKPPPLTAIGWPSGWNSGRRDSRASTVSVASSTASAQSSASSHSLISFDLEVCHLPRKSTFGLSFKRLHGSYWNYRKLTSNISSAVASVDTSVSAPIAAKIEPLVQDAVH